MKYSNLRFSNLQFVILQLSLVLISLFLMQVISSSKVSAAYDGSRIIDNSIFLDAQSMNAQQIQNFLNSRGGQIAGMSFAMNCDTAGQQAKNIYMSLGAPCGGTASAASIIYYSSQVYGVNPRVILATMQKEQSLVTATNPTARQYAQAMGYACPTSGSCNDSSNFFWQIDNGTWVLRFHYERARGNMSWWYTSSSWTCGTEKNFYKPSLYPGQSVRFYDQNGTLYRTYFIQNAATSSFYCYTPPMPIITLRAYMAELLMAPRVCTTVEVTILYYSTSCGLGRLNTLLCLAVMKRPTLH